MSALRSPLKMVGGKFASAGLIVAAFPPPHLYTTYVEPCGGAAHVLFAKPPYNHDEVYNDLCNNLTTFWKQIQCNAEIMQQRLDDLPYSREIYYEFYRSIFDGTLLDPLERAIRYFYVLRSTGTGWVRRSPVGWNHTGQNCRAFRSAVDLFSVVKERLCFVCIDNRDVLATIKRYDSPKTLFYIDPPYHNTEMYYEASKGGFPHEELATLLSRVKGYVALSYYAHHSIDQLYPMPHWRQITWEQTKHSDIKSERAAQATEILLTNYDLFCQQQELWQI